MTSGYETFENEESLVSLREEKILQILNLTFNAVLFRMFPIHFTMHGVPCFCFSITPTFAIELYPKVPRKKSCAYQQQQQQQQRALFP